jgi:hypothetical protein
MSSAVLDFVGKVGDPTTQGLGRLISQYVKSPKLIGLLTGIYGMAQGMELLMRRMGRLLDLDDDIASFQPNTYGAEGDQLRIIGQLVGVSSTLPDGSVLADADFRQLVRAKKYRNSAHSNMASLRRALWWIFDPVYAQALTDEDATATSDIDLLTEDLGHMGTRVCLTYPIAGEITEPTTTQLQLIRIPTGRSNLPAGLLPRTAGTSIDLQWQPAEGVFSFSTVAHPDVLLTPDGVGFSPDPNNMTGTWAIAFT